MSDKDLKTLIFELNGGKYATDIKEVERILGYEQPTVVPEAPFFVEGVINYEENILPVINLSKKFKLKEQGKNDDRKIIVVKRQEKKFGIIVDSVYEVRDISGECIEEAPVITNDKKRNYIKGLMKIEQNIIILLDLQKILSLQDEENIF